MKTILSLILTFLVFFANCSTQKKSSSSPAVLALATNKKSSNSIITSLCHVKSVGPSRDKDGNFMFGSNTYDRRLFKATTSPTKLFTKESLANVHNSTYVEVDAKIANTILTVTHFETPVNANGTETSGSNITVYKNFTGCSDPNNRFNATPKLYDNDKKHIPKTGENLATEKGSTPDFQLTGTSSISVVKGNTKSVTFKIAGRYLLQFYNPGNGNSGPAPFLKTSKNEYPIIQITHPKK